MRPAPLFGLLALAASMGALLVGRWVVLPELGHHPELVDANFAKAIARPLHLRLSEVVLAGHLVVAALTPAWLGKRWASTVGLLLVAGSAAHRFILLPVLYATWSKADLIAGRPVEHVLTAQRYEWVELALVGLIAALQLGLVVSHLWLRDRPPVPGEDPGVEPPAPQSDPAPCPAA